MTRGTTAPHVRQAFDASFATFVETWNESNGLQTPALHRTIAGWLADRWDAGERELLLLAFRNSGKSTLVGLFSAWLLASRPETRILVLAAEFDLARKMVRNVKRVIERHTLAEHLRPTRAEQWASDQFTVNRAVELRDPSMLAKGVGANVTGSRADVVVCDDVEVPNTCDTAPKREDLRQRLGEIDYVLVPGGLQLFVGTPHTRHSIYAAEIPESGPGMRELGEEAPFLAGFARLELPLLDEAGNSRWPDRFPPEKVEAIRRRTGPNKFASQMMLRPLSLAEGRLDPDRLRLYDAELDYREGNREAVLTLDGHRMVSVSAWWDPAYGAPDKGDSSVVACVFTDDGGDYWLHRVLYVRHDPALADEVPEADQQCRAVARFLDSNFLPGVWVESNGPGTFLAGLLKKALAEEGIEVSVRAEHSTRPKDLRIVDAFDAVLAAGRLHAHRTVWDTPFVAEMREWRPAAGCRDDGLDAVAGCLLSEPVRLARRPRAGPARPHKPWRPGGAGVRAPTEFEV